MLTKLFLYTIAKLFVFTNIFCFISVKAHVCQESSQYSSCSSNPVCKCLKLASNSSQGVCALLHMTCSELNSCFGEYQLCFQPNHVCVQHPQCQTRPLCYPKDKMINYFCPPKAATDNEICPEAVWLRNGITVAGGNGRGDGLNQLDFATGIFIDDDDRSVYVADQENQRIIKWDISNIASSKNGVVVADRNGIDDGSLFPVDVTVVKDGTMFICDYGSHRIIRWPRNASRGETFISNISCTGLIISNDQYLYVTEVDEHRVTRWDIQRNTSKKIVAGGNGQGSNLNQLNSPYYSFTDKDHSVYVADHRNNRIMKWIENAEEGILISDTDKLSLPTSVVVDQMGSIYVTDTENTQIVRYLKGSTQGIVIIGGADSGNRPDQLSEPFDISFDRYGNLYVVDVSNDRVQMYKIDKSACNNGSH